MVSKAWGLALALCVQLGQAGAAQPDFGGARASADARYMAQWVMDNADHGGRPFAIVDKKQGRMFVFDGRGRLKGESAVLVGSTWGDHIVPGVGTRAQTGEVRADERTTPAGRFDSAPGRNLAGEKIIWVDYASAFAIHRVRPGRAQARREAKLASATPGDNRDSLGCVVVPVDFYTGVIDRVLGQGRSVVYVLPETRSVRDLFGEG
jgi:hypothetical protein